MQTYRSKQTLEAVQFTGTAIPGVTCDGSSLDKDTREAAKFANGCDSSRAHLLHVHTKDTGGMKVLKPSDWIFPVEAGPFGVADDAKFQSHWEVPGTQPVVAEQAEQAAPAQTVDEILAEAGLPGLQKIRKALAVAYTPPKTLDELLAEQGLPSAEEIKAVMADEAAGKVSTPDTPPGTPGVVPLAEELRTIAPVDAPIDHVEA